MPLFFEGYYADDEDDKDVEEHFPDLEVASWLVLDPDKDPDSLVPSTMLKYPEACHLIVRELEIAWRATPHGRPNRVETTDLPISIIKDIALHDDYHAWVIERDGWSEEHGSAGLRNDLQFSLTAIERDYVKERAAIELPGFIPDFAGLAQLRAPKYEPSGAILAEAQALSQHGHHAYTHELREPPYAQSTVEKPGPTGKWKPCECIVIEGYLGCEYKLIKEFPVSF